MFCSPSASPDAPTQECRPAGATAPACPVLHESDSFRSAAFFRRKHLARRTRKRARTAAVSANASRNSYVRSVEEQVGLRAAHTLASASGRDALEIATVLLPRSSEAALRAMLVDGSAVGVGRSSSPHPSRRCALPSSISASPCPSPDFPSLACCPPPLVDTEFGVLLSALIRQQRAHQGVSEPDYVALVGHAVQEGWPQRPVEQLRAALRPLLRAEGELLRQWSAAEQRALCAFVLRVGNGSWSERCARAFNRWARGTGRPPRSPVALRLRHTDPALSRLNSLAVEPAALDWLTWSVEERCRLFAVLLDRFRGPLACDSAPHSDHEERDERASGASDDEHGIDREKREHEQATSMALKGATARSALICEDPHEEVCLAVTRLYNEWAVQHAHRERSEYGVVQLLRGLLAVEGADLNVWSTEEEEALSRACLKTNPPTFFGGCAALACYEEWRQTHNKPRRSGILLWYRARKQV
jgi:hypothetical protein